MGSRRPYVKAFEDTSMQWRNLSYPARGLFALMHFSGVEPDGTVAVLKSLDEPLHFAIIRWVGVPRHWRRGIAEPTNELLRAGYIQIDCLRVKLANHVERQAWRGGNIPAPFVEPHDTVTGEIHDPERPERDTNATSTRRQHDVNTTSTRD